MFEHKLKMRPGLPPRYDVVGKFPVAVKDFVDAVLERSRNDIRVTFWVNDESIQGSTRPCICYKREGYIHGAKWIEELQSPENLLDQISERHVVKCFADGDYGQMHYSMTIQ